MSARHHKLKILKHDKDNLSPSKVSSATAELVKLFFEHCRPHCASDSQALEYVTRMLKQPFTGYSDLVTISPVKNMESGRNGKMVALKDRKKHKANGKAPHSRSNLAWPKGDSYEAIFARAIRRWRENILQIESIPQAAEQLGLKYQVWNRLEKGAYPQTVLKHANRFRQLAKMDPIEFLAMGRDEEPEA